MSDKLDRQKYADCMTFIRYRLEVIDRFLSKKVTTGYEIPDIETMCLQYRKVFELIAMSSLCANKDKCSEVKSRFDKLWNTTEIIKFVQGLNPSFYPTPINRKFNDETETDGTFTDIESGFLTLDELIEAHGRCGNLLHADNPYRMKKISAETWTQYFNKWHEKLIVLLQLHRVQLYKHDVQWFTVMRFNTEMPVQVAEMKRQIMAVPDNLLKSPVGKTRTPGSV